MPVADEIKHVWINFAKIYLGGIPALLNEEGAFLSFICSLTAIEALGGFLEPTQGNGQRFRAFVQGYFSAPFPSQADKLWKLRNAAVHGFSPGPYGLVHHKSNLHLTTAGGGQTILNAEDFYAELVAASKRYFDALSGDANLQSNFQKRAADPDTGLLVVASAV